METMAASAGRSGERAGLASKLLARALPAAAALLLALLPSAAQAADPRGGDAVIVGPNEVVEDDLYAFGQTVDIQGTVWGDVVAGAATVIVGGTVGGDLIAGGGTVSVPGRVGGSVRAGGGSVAITGSVREDVVVGGGSLSIGRGATVERDLLMGGGSAVVDGRIGRRVQAGVRDLVINGTVGSGVDVEVNTLSLGGQASIGGDLIYRSDQEAAVASGATVRGTTQRLEPRVERREPVNRAADPVIDWLRMLAGVSVLGLLFMLVLPDFSLRAVDALRGSPWASLGLGCLTLVVVPIVAILVFGLGLIVGGWWLAFLLLAIYGIALALSFVLAGLFTGRLAIELSGQPGIHPALALLLGLVILMLVGLVPVLGPLVVAVAMLFGLGALILAAGRARMAASGERQMASGE